MRLALDLAARGRGRTSPNPMVGCVIVSPDGEVVGRGHHERAGDAHAEVLALREAGDRARGATLYCTLEPCAHQGRTGPCAEAVAAAGIRRVVAAMQDPNPVVAGRGLAYLRARHVEVTVGVGEREAARLNAPFVTAVTKRRPFVTLKVATSLDGRVAEAAGRRTPLTSAAANEHVHWQRFEVDAIGVGSQTVLSDDPLLTARGVSRTRPLTRVIFDTRLRTSPRARIWATRDEGPVLIMTTDEATREHPERAGALESVGAELVRVGRHDVSAALAELGRREVRWVILEGGPTLHRACWAAGVVDHVQVYVTPHVLGAEGVPWTMPSDFSIPLLEDLRAGPVGPDVLIEGHVHRTH